MLIRKKDAASMVRLRVPTGPPAKGQEVRLATASPSRCEELTNVRESILEILEMHWRGVEVTTIIQELQEKLGIVQEDPHCTLVPVGSNEEVKNSLLPKFPGTQREGSDSEQRILPDPPMDGHRVTHQNAVLRAAGNVSCGYCQK